MYVKNIQGRIRKGTGLSCQILKILRTVNLGSYTIEISLLLRNSILINGMLTNSEVWYHTESSETSDLERVDLHFMQKVLGTPHTVPAAAIYLETGIMPLGIVIKQRRLIYLHNILQSNKNGMLHKVFTVQWHFPCQGDWTLQV